MALSKREEFLSHTLRGYAMLLVMFHSLHGFGHVRIFLSTLKFLFTGISEARLHITRHEYCDLDAEGAHLVGESLCKTWKGRP